MRIARSISRRLTAAFGVAATLALVMLSLSTPATAQPAPPAMSAPIIELANPAAGDVLPVGDYVLTGTAYDPSALEGAGVSHVDLFLGQRDKGGLFLGSAVPGQDLISEVAAESHLGQIGFQKKVTLPKTSVSGADIIAYAYAATGAEASTSVPVYIGAAPTLTRVAQAPLSVVEMPAPAVQGDAMFTLANPNNGDVVLYGDYFVSGAAGPAIDRVEFFIGERDSGGMFLGSATPANGLFSTKLTIPTALAGGHDLCVYASTANGQETELEVPIHIGSAPTPTPVPAT
jgi:hypothetical protein